MSFSDDQASPAPPFFGDETGQIFDAPDMVAQSLAQLERVVDTQSGFQVVVQKVSGQQLLYVRRKLGTPPASSILLTPDEARQLSRILIDAPSVVPGRSSTLSPQAQTWLAHFEQQRAASWSASRHRMGKPSPRPVAVALFLLILILLCGLIGLGWQNATRFNRQHLHLR